MDIQFDTEEIRQLCISKTIAERKFGGPVAHQIQSRISDLRAVEGVAELLVGLDSAIEGAQGQRRSVDLTDGYKMIFEANNKEKPLGLSGLIDWAKIDRIKIITIDKGHNP